jgi:hypothetical protein
MALFQQETGTADEARNPSRRREIVVKGLPEAQTPAPKPVPAGPVTAAGATPLPTILNPPTQPR